MISELNAQTTYRYRITASNNTNYRVINSPIELTTAKEQRIDLLVPTLTDPGSLRVVFGASSEYQNIRLLKKGEHESSFTDTGCLTSPCVISNLSPGVIFSFKVQVETQSKEVVEGSTVSGIAMSMPEAFVSMNQTSETALFLAWNPVPGALSYMVEYGRENFLSSITTQSTNTMVSDLSPGLYQFRLKAMNQAGSLMGGVQKRVMIGPFALSPLSVVDSNTLTATWSPASQAHSYEVYYGENLPSNKAPCTSSPCSITGLTAGTTYFVRVKALAPMNGEFWSPQVAGTPLQRSVLTLTPSIFSMQGNWTTAGLGASYRLELGTSPGVYPFSSVTTTTTGSVSGLNANTLYYGRVWASNEDGSLVSNEMAATTAADTTLSLSVPIITGVGEFLFSFTKGNGIHSVVLKQGTSLGSYDTTTTCTHSPCLVTGLTAGTTYFFQLEGTDFVSGSHFSEAVSGTPLSLPVVSLTGGNAQIGVSWTGGGAGATYTLKYGTSPGVYGTTVSSNVTSPSSITGLTPGVTYYVVVIAANNQGSLQSNQQVLKSGGSNTLSLASPTLTAANQLQFAWTQGNGIETVVLKQGTSPGTYATTTSCTSSPCLINSGLIGGTPYYYRLEALDHLGEVVHSSEVTGVPLGGDPTLNLPVQASATSANLAWSAVSGVASYVLEYGLTSGIYGTQLSSVTTTNAVVTGLTAGSRYFFRVRAQNSHGFLGSNERSITPIDAITLENPTLNAASSLILAYNVPNGATSVSIVYGANSGSYPTNSGCSSSPCTLSLTAGTTYYFQAIASNSDQGSIRSSEVSGTPLGMVALNGPLQAGLGMVGLSWLAVSGATSYIVSHGPSTGTYDANNTAVTGTTDTVTGLTAGVNRYLKLTAINASGSLASPEQLFTPVGAVMLSPLTFGGPNQLTYAWSVSAGATSYQVRRGTSTGSYPVATNCSTSPCTETGLASGGSFFVQVTASNGNGGSMVSNEESGAPMSMPVLVPSHINNDVRLTWASAGAGVTYELKYGTSTGTYPTLISSSAISPLDLTSLTPETTYFFQLVGTNDSGMLTALETSIERPFTFSPSSAALGQLLTLSGRDYTNLTEVTIGGALGVIVYKDAAKARVLVMPGAASGLVAATIDGSSYIKSGFTLTPNASPSTGGTELRGSNKIGSAGEGSSLAISSTGDIVLSGGPSDNSGRGAVWIYTRSGSTWSEQARLVSQDAEINNYFGHSVSLSADGNTAFITQLKLNAGQIYTRSENAWTFRSSFHGTGATLAENNQGKNGALSADGRTAALGGGTDDNSIGAVWVFEGSGSSWSQQGSKIVGSGGIGTSDQGGSETQRRAIALTANGNMLAVGGRGDDSNRGAIWIYTRSGSTWSQMGSKLVPSGTGTNAYIGETVALSLDGTRLFASSATSAKAWIWRLENGSFVEEIVDMNLGTSMGSGASTNADGSVFSMSSWNFNSLNGPMHILTRTGNVWSWTRELWPSGFYAANKSGWGLGTNSLVSYDGTTGVFGAPYAADIEGGTTGRGAIYIVNN
jgi:hypothetical protein